MNRIKCTNALDATKKFFRQPVPCALLVLAGTPSAVSSYIMAQNMNNDAVLANGIVAVTTLFSAVTVTGWIFLLRTMALI